MNLTEEELVRRLRDVAVGQGPEISQLLIGAADCIDEQLLYLDEIEAANDRDQERSDRIDELEDENSELQEIIRGKNKEIADLEAIGARL